MKEEDEGSKDKLAGSKRAGSDISGLGGGLNKK